MFNYTSIERWSDDPTLLVLYTFLAQTDFTIIRAQPVQTIYQLLGNLCATKETAAHVLSAIQPIYVKKNNKPEDTIYKNILPKTAQYTFIHPDILYTKDISVVQKAEYIKAVKNLSLRRRLEGGKLIIPADYVEYWIDTDGLPVITKSKDKKKIRFNLEEQINLIKEIK